METIVADSRPGIRYPILARNSDLLTPLMKLGGGRPRTAYSPLRFITLP
jgi:hypothetical protein